MNITVLIANCNYGKYLRESINSVFNQSKLPQTLCIVDDNSDDNSWEIISDIIDYYQVEEEVQNDVLIKKAIFDDISIIAVKLPTRVGPSEARNVGIYLTKEFTDIYAILDADDTFLPNKLEECIKPFSNPQVGVVYANYFNLNNGVSFLQVKEPYDMTRLGQECIVHSGALIRNHYLQQVKDEFGYYDRNMRTCEDWDLWIRLSKVCIFYHVPLALTIALVHPNNSSNSVDKSIWEYNWNRIREKYFK